MKSGPKEDCAKQHLGSCYTDKILTFRIYVPVTPLLPPHV